MDPALVIVYVLFLFYLLAFMVFSVVVAALGITQLVLVLRKLRDPVQPVVEWCADEPGTGGVRLKNQGLDTAFEVTVTVWDAHESVTLNWPAVSKGEHVVVELPYRTAHGPDPVAVSPRAPRDEPPTVFPASGEGRTKHREVNQRHLTEAWEVRRATADHHDLLVRKQADRLRLQQVNVRVMWRSRQGQQLTLDVPLV